MNEIEKELQNNPVLRDLFRTAVKCDDEQIKEATNMLNELKRRQEYLQED